MLRPLSFAFALVTLLFVSAAWAGESVVMVFGRGYPPFYSLGHHDGNEQDTMHGAFIDFLSAFEREYGYSIRKIRLPRLRMNEWIRDGRADAFSLNSPLFTPEEDKAVLQFTQPIWRSGDHLVVLASSPIRRADLESLGGKRLGLVYGNGYGPLEPMLESGAVKQQRVYRAEQLPALLLGGRVAGYVGNRHVAPWIWEIQGFRPKQFRVIEPPLYEFDLAIGVRKEQGQLLRDLNEFIGRSRENGLLDSINQRYFLHVNE